jgi:RNA polymerase-binding transcription factor DksA
MDLEYARNLLVDKRVGLESLQEQMRESRELGESQQESSGALSSHDQHPADAATQTFQREQDQSVQERLEYDVSEIDAALERIESGDYGRCETCGKTISDERLEILPATRYCLEHAPRQVGPGSESANQVTQELDQV